MSRRFCLQKFSRGETDKIGTLASARNSRTPCARACGPAGIRQRAKKERPRVSTRMPHPQERAAPDRLRQSTIPLSQIAPDRTPDGPKVQARSDCGEPNIKHPLAGAECRRASLARRSSPVPPGAAAHETPCQYRLALAARSEHLTSDLASEADCRQLPSRYL